MTRDEMVHLVMAALEELRGAAQDLESPTHPATLWPRPREFRITPRISWPNIRNGTVTWTSLHEDGVTEWHLNIASDLTGVAKRIVVRDCGGRPRLVLRAIRRIQSAAAWCRARAEGRRRAAQEILRQQARAVEALEAEGALQVLGG